MMRDYFDGLLGAGCICAQTGVPACPVHHAQYHQDILQKIYPLYIHRVFFSDAIDGEYEDITNKRALPGTEK
jgi:uncharacterized protein YqkB